MHKGFAENQRSPVRDDSDSKPRAARYASATRNARLAREFIVQCNKNG
jgi:hypothetical protein